MLNITPKVLTKVLTNVLQYAIIWVQKEKGYTMEKIICNNGDAIYVNDFEVNGAILFYSQKASNGNGYHRFYISDEEGILIYDSDKGWTGYWSDDVGLTFSEWFKADENDEANFYFDIDRDDYFSFNFNDLCIVWNKEEPTLVVGVPMHDALYNKSIVFKLEDEKTYEVKTIRNGYIEEESMEEVAVCFGCYYVGSAKGEIWWIERSEEVEDLSFSELLAIKEEINYDTSDFSFATKSDIEKYIIVDEIAGCIVSLECDNWGNCLCEDVI